MKYENIEGEWGAPIDTIRSRLPVTDKDYIENVKKNCLLDLPNLSMSKEHDRIMVMVCGGPTAKLYIDEIREKRKDDRYRIFSSNKTHDWLIGNGIIPHYQFIIDPKESKVEDVRNPHKDVKYLIGISCNHKVFQALEGYDVTRVFSVSNMGTPSDTDIVRVLFAYDDSVTFLIGGTMAGLRAMTLADLMGFRTVEYYGFDSCFFEYDKDGDPIYYSYHKPRKENIKETETIPDPKDPTAEPKWPYKQMFFTSPVFESQAKQFLKWKDNYSWIKFIVHGRSLTSAINEIQDELDKPKHNLLITPLHKSLNKEMFLRDNKINEIEGACHFGTSGHLYAGQISVIIGRMIKKLGKISVLDYGCGERTLEYTVPPIIGMDWHNYDPCIDGFDDMPEPADLVICTDVMEHIEPDCLGNVLSHIKSLTKQLAYFSICTKAARKSYPDGSNCHKIIQSPEWWVSRLRKYFHIIEAENKPDNYICVCQNKALTK